MRKSLGIVIVAILCTAIGALAAESTVFPGKDWEESTPEAQGMDARRLAEAVVYLKANSGRDGVDQLVIVRHGRMVWKGPKIDEVHGIWSATKSFTSTVLGLLIDDGKCKLDTRAAEFVPEMKAVFPEVTLRHFTTMTSGYRAVGDEPRGDYTHGPSVTPFDPGPEPLFAPGSHYAYWDSAMNQFAHVLTRIAGEPIEDLFRRRVAEPIGMNPDQWKWGNFGEVNGIVVNGGSGNSNKHIFISAREIARLGLLFLHKGNWDGKQLISAEWVEQATSLQVPASIPPGHDRSAGRPGFYGFNWWVNGPKEGGARKWPDAPAGTFAASGHNNNDMFAIPEWDMVVARLGLDQGSDGAISDETYNEFLKRVGAAILPAE